ncbi:MAG: ATP-binding protein [Rhodocyclaceae bacterium]|nr:ATP-binding protein [Rhodocyclaceae bacterium]
MRIHLDSRQLRVDDNGVGIRADEVDRVFERYYRGSDSRGAGIGLSLVKRICDRCGWRISLAPGEAGGTRATLEFNAAS